MNASTRCSLHDTKFNATGECDECSRVISARRLASVTVFDDGDDDYRAWVAQHRGGYVINIQHSYNPSDARLHQAQCYTINDLPARGNVFVGDYIKVCALRRIELDAWAIHNVGMKIPTCEHCF